MRGEVVEGVGGGGRGGVAAGDDEQDRVLQQRLLRLARRGVFALLEGFEEVRRRVGGGFALFPVLFGLSVGIRVRRGWGNWCRRTACLSRIAPWHHSRMIPKSPASPAWLSIRITHGVAAM